MIAISPLTRLLTYLVVACGMLPLFPWLTVFPRLVVLSGLLYSLALDRYILPRLKPWQQNSVITPVFFYYALQFSPANPIQPVVNVLAIMVAVRLSGEKSVRHTLQIYALSVFCLASSSLFELSPLFLLYLGLLLFLIALALVLLTFQDQDSTMTVSKTNMKRILLSALLMPLLAIPLLLMFFPIMPRTQKPLWNFMAQPSYRTTGYSDSVEPGGQNSVTSSRKLAFRAEMPGIEHSGLYWRATVFNRTDGNKWTRSPQIPEENANLTKRRTQQIIYPESSSSLTLVALDRAASITAANYIKKSPDGVFELFGAGGKRLSYTADSAHTGVVAQRNAIDRSFYLQLPDRMSPKIKTLAKEIAGSASTDNAKTEALERYYREGDFRYSTKNLATGSNALEIFLFDKKSGHCEFFASSFALILRSAGVPCRLVGGYLGGEYNQLGGYYSVTDDRAHVWVEVYIDGVGWKRIDPSSFASNSAEALAPAARNFASRITMTIDSLNHIWNRSVITYDFDRQIRILSRTGEHLNGLSPYGVMTGMLPYGAILVLVAAVIVVFRKRSLFKPREQRILDRFLLQVASRFDKSYGDGSKGLFEIAAAEGNQHITEFVEIYAGSVYRDRRLTDAQYHRLQDIIHILKETTAKTT